VSVRLASDDLTRRPGDYRVAFIPDYLQDDSTLAYGTMCSLAVGMTCWRVRLVRAGDLLRAVVIRLTLDTNLLQEYWREQERQDVVANLLDLAASGEAELVVTARISADIPDGPLADRLRELPEMGIAQIGGVFRLDYSALDGTDMLGSATFETLRRQAEAELQRRGRTQMPDWPDWDHLQSHFIMRRDVFMTWDKRLLEAAELLSVDLPIIARTPEGFLSSRSTMFPPSRQ
jgi:hypothetical protein